MKVSNFSSHLVKIFMSFQNIEIQGGASVRNSPDSLKTELIIAFRCFENVNTGNKNYMAVFEKHSSSNHGIFPEFSKLILSFILSKYEILLHFPTGNLIGLSFGYEFYWCVELS